MNKLKIWWNSTGKTFTKEVKNIEEAKLLLKTLTEYDLYLDNIIQQNAGGLEEFIGENNRQHIETNNGWIEWYNKQGRDIMEILYEGEE